MRNAICDTSPILYLYRIGVLNWLAEIFERIILPNAVVRELNFGRQKGYETPDFMEFSWVEIVDPISTPFEWLSLDLGLGELSAMALALENPDHVILLDDALARNTATAAGLPVWGTLKILLVAKSIGLTERIAPHVDQLSNKGMWLSESIRQRILDIAGE